MTERGRKMKKIIALLCCMALLFSLAGCSSGTDAGASAKSDTAKVKTEAKASKTAKASHEKSAEAAETVTGQIVSLENGTVTLQLGELTEEETSADDTAASEDASAESEKSGKKHKTRTFTAGEETAQVDLNGVSITKHREEITLDELEAGDILMIGYDDSGAITSVKVKSLGGNHEKGSKGSKKPAVEETADETTTVE